MFALNKINQTRIVEAEENELLKRSTIDQLTKIDDERLLDCFEACRSKEQAINNDSVLIREASESKGLFNKVKNVFRKIKTIKENKNKIYIFEDTDNNIKDINEIYISLCNEMRRFAVDFNTDIEALYDFASEITGLSVNEFYISHRDRIISPHNTYNLYDISNGDVLQFHPRLFGGAHFIFVFTKIGKQMMSVPIDITQPIEVFL